MLKQNWSLLEIK